MGGGTSFSALFRLFVHTAISCLRDCASTSNAFIPFSATFILRPMFKQPEVNKKLLRKLVVDRTQMTSAAFTHCHIHSGGKSHLLWWCSVPPNNNILAYISWTISAWFQCSKKLRSTGRCTFTLLMWNGSNLWHGDSFQRSNNSHKYWMCGVVTSYINIFLTALSHLCQHSHVVLDGSGKASIGTRCSAGSLSPNRKGFTMNLTPAQWVLCKTQKITFGVLTKGW